MLLRRATVSNVMTQLQNFPCLLTGCGWGLSLCLTGTYNVYITHVFYFCFLHCVYLFGYVNVYAVEIQYITETVWV